MRVIADAVLARAIRIAPALSSCSSSTTVHFASILANPTNVNSASSAIWSTARGSRRRFSQNKFHRPHYRHLSPRESPLLQRVHSSQSQSQSRTVARTDDVQSSVATPSTSDDTAPSKASAVHDQAVSSPLKSATYENIYNLPNLLTVSRLIAAPATAYLLLHDHNQWALALFAYAGITDLVDGWLARKWKLQTVAGSVIDPMADKALMIILTVTLALKSAIPLSLATLILGRDAALAVAAIYYRYASLPAPKTFMRYWDFSLPSAQVHPTTVSKYNTFLQLILIGGTLALPVVTGVATFDALGLTSASVDASTTDAIHPGLHTAVVGLQAVVAATTVWSGLSYAFLPRAVTMLGADEALKAKQGARGRAIIGLTFGAIVLYALTIALSPRDLIRERKDRIAARDDHLP